MTKRNGRLIGKATLAAMLALAFPGSGRTQLGSALPGFYQLPNSDFTWIWGADNELELRGPSDFRSRGQESGFSCELTANLSPSNRLTQNEIRQIESQLGTSLAFIQESAYLMNDWEFGRQIIWGKLACVKPEGEDDPEDEQRRIDRALERAIRDRERRRARDDN